MSNSLLKYLELDSTPIENTFYQGGAPSDYEEDKALATEYGHQYIELYMHLSNLLSSVSNTTDSMTQYKKFFTRKFGKHWCCSNPREGNKMVYTWNLLDHKDGNMGVLNLSTKGFSLEVPHDTKAEDAIKIWERFAQECYKPATQVATQSSVVVAEDQP